MHGLLVVDKPEGMTSADVVRVAKRKLRCRTGHLGTLDPFASGVLPLCLGEGTKIAQFLNTADKEYTGRIQLGRGTDTGDRTGRTVEESAVDDLDDARVQEVADRFHGESMQVPPMHSALKRQGTPLYKLARRGIVVEREPRKIRIDALRLRTVPPNQLDFVVSCSKGTYVRVLAQDIAAALGTVGYLACLRRTRFGRFAEADAVPLETLEANADRILSLSDALAEFPGVQLDQAGCARARQGYVPLLRTLRFGENGEVARLLAPDGSLVAVVVREGRNGWRYARVFAAGEDDSRPAVDEPAKQRAVGKDPEVL